MFLACQNERDVIRQAKLLEYAGAKRASGVLNDVTIKAGTEIISANRMVSSLLFKVF